MARIVLATIGSLGDLHPFVAIGRALDARGEQVTLAVPDDGLTKVRAAGLEAVAIFPSYASICARLDLTEQEVATRVIDDNDFVIDQVLMPSLATSVAALDEAAEGADVLAGSIFAFAAGIVAEKRKLPLVSVVLQPMTLFSSYEPPTAPRFEIMRHEPRTAIGRSGDRGTGRFIRSQGPSCEAGMRHGSMPCGGIMVWVRVSACRCSITAGPQQPRCAAGQANSGHFRPTRRPAVC